MAEGQRSPPNVSAFSVSAQSPSKLNWKPSEVTGLSVVVLHTSEMGWEAEGGQNEGGQGALGSSCQPGPGKQAGGQDRKEGSRSGGLSGV